MFRKNGDADAKMCGRMLFSRAWLMAGAVYVRLQVRPGR